MSKLFFDHLVVLEEVDSEIKKIAETKEEREELWGLIDESVHHRVLDAILDKLPHSHHEEFLEKFHKSPHDETLMDYLKEKIGENIEEILKAEIGDLAFGILSDLREKKK